MTAPDAKFFEDWTKSLEDELKNKLGVQVPPAFQEACRAVTVAAEGRHATDVELFLLNKQNPPPPDKEQSVATLSKALEEATKKLDEARDRAQQAAFAVFQEQQFNTVEHDNDLMTYCILQCLRPVDWEAGCKRFDYVLPFLQHKNDLAKRMIQAGGARKGNYVYAVEIYHQCAPDVQAETEEQKAVLERLSVAVAIEMCCYDYCYFDTKNHIDPPARFRHFKAAFLNGDLDPAYETFTIWELRHAVNCDAPDAELEWGRQSLRNYKPGLVYLNDPSWRYSEIVRTDVPHKPPDWYKEPKGYDQILSGGGRCGPRAWYARFICQAFGIPVWGVKQPGHAAISRWTPNGFVTNLGADWKHNSWENRTGRDFELESRARILLADDEVYWQKVVRLECIACLFKEKNDAIIYNFLPHEQALWYSFALFRRHQLAAESVGTKREYPKPVISTNNKIQAILDAPMERKPIVKDDKGVIIIPAATASKPDKDTRSIFFPKSFEGGQQLTLPGESVEYTLEEDIVGKEPKKYNLTCRVCTVHRNEGPLVFKAGGGSDVNIDIPYTMGMWQETNPVVVEIGGSKTVIVVTRTTKAFVMALKEFKLVPV